MKVICIALTVLFVALKLTGVIAWSWLWVLAPLWIPLAFWFGFWTAVILGGAGLAIILMFVACIAAAMERKQA